MDADLRGSQQMAEQTDNVTITMASRMDVQPSRKRSPYFMLHNHSITYFQFSVKIFTFSEKENNVDIAVGLRMGRVKC